MRDVDGSEHIVGGTFEEVDPPRRLRFTWRWESGVPYDFDSLVTIDLVPVGEATELTLVHTGFPDDEIAATHEQGWGGGLVKLVALFA